MPAATPYKGRVNEPRPADDGGALKGATLAFGAKPNVKAKPVTKNYSGTNGALAAALSVGRHLQPPQSGRRNSDSRIAANLAASRSSSLSPMNTGQRSHLSTAVHSPLYSPNLPRSSSVSSTGSNTKEYGQKQQGPADVKQIRRKKVPSLEPKNGNKDHILDTTSIPPTNKLISIFEDKSPPQKTTVRPIPERTSSLRSKDKVTKPATVVSNGQEKSKTAVQPVRPRPKSQSLRLKDKDTGPPAIVSSGPDKPRTLGKVDKPRPNSSSLPSKNKDAGTPGTISNGQQEKAKPLAEAVRPTPRSPKPSAYRAPPTSQKLCRRPSVRARAVDTISYNNAQDESSSDDSFVSASTEFKEIEIRKGAPSPQKASIPIPPPPRSKRMSQVSSEDRGRRISVPEMEYHGAFVPHLTGDSLANAIVASSLASSRVPSPSRAPPVPPKSTKHSLFHQQRLQDSRTPSPAKGGFRKTLRNPHKEDEEDEQMERRGRKKLLHKHPNKHAEGDRRRWRDEITERERKRYEAVWASNKGLFLPSPSRSNSNEDISESSPSGTVDQSDLVLNIVVRDIWKRSRLGSDVLEEVWELVNRAQPFALTREEFVVGLWLIDQRLKGRKLPIKVSDSVWGSASRVRVIPPKRRR